MNISYRSDKGNYRGNNEDSFAFNEVNGVAVIAVADGIGGINGGEVASSIAANRVVELVSNDLINNLSGLSDKDIKDRIINYIGMINKEIVCKASEDKTLKGMGTTLTVAIVLARKVYIAHVGDTRAYLIHGSSITQLTKDHVINENSVNKLTKSLGVNEFFEPDFYCYNIIYGDVLLLSSDGLHGVLANHEILACVKKHNDLDGCIVNLFDRAYANESKDNVTAVLAHIRPN